MQAKIYCRPVAKDVHEFYLMLDGEKYYLFEQRFYMSNHNYFKKGVSVDSIGDFSKANSITIRITLEKLPKYLKKVSKRYGVEFARKTKSRTKQQRQVRTYGWADLEEVA